MKFRLLILFLLTISILQSQDNVLEVRNNIGITNNIFNNSRLTELTFKPSTYYGFDLVSNIQLKNRLYLNLGSGIALSSTNLYQPELVLTEETFPIIDQNESLLYGSIIIGGGIKVFRRIIFEVNVRPSLVLFKSISFNGKPGSLFVIRNSNVFTEALTKIQLTENINLGIGYSLGLVDIYERKYTTNTTIEGGADIFLQQYFVQLNYLIGVK